MIRSIFIHTYIPIALLLLVSCSHEKQDMPIKNPALQKAFDICKDHTSIALDTLNKYSDLSLSLATKEANPFYFQLASLYRAQYYLNAGLYDSVLLQCSKIDQFPYLLQDTLTIHNKSSLLRNIALYHKGLFREAVDSNYALMERLEKSEVKTDLYRIYNLMGLCHVELLRLNEAFPWYYKVIAIPEEEDPRIKAFGLYNLADNYSNLGKTDSAIKYLNEALKISKKHNFIIINNNALNTLGKIYFEQKKYKEALKYVWESIALRKSNENLYYTVMDYKQLTKIYAAMHQYDSAIIYAEKAQKIAMDNELTSLYYTVGEALWMAYYPSGKYKETAEVLNNLLSIIYENNKSASAESLAELEKKYESQKKELLIEKQKSELQTKNTIIYSGIVFLVLSILIVFMLYRNTQFRQKQKLQQALILEQEEAARAVIQAEEKERNKISQNIHDNVGQLLSGLKMNLQALDDRIETKENDNIFQNSMNLLEEAIIEIRNIAHQILPNNIVRFGLANSMRSLIQKLNQERLRIQLHIEGKLEIIDRDTQLMVYRIIQEMINNVIKHSSAQNMSIDIRFIGSILTTKISDDGVGFDVNKLKSAPGIGINSINTRIRYLKGSIKINSKINEGTQISLSIPVPQ